jgi:16S rRNA (cytosine1402-N4)-methyltransferase
MTSGRDTGQPDVAGGLARHVPVLVQEVVAHLNLREGGTYIDGTFGAGGYSRALLAAADCKVIAIDRDHAAIAAGAPMVEESRGRLVLVEGKFSNLDDAAEGAGSIDGVVLDLGVSSLQLDTPERGFSFRLDGPLDMRMGGGGASAADIIANASERDLSTIIAVLGEERRARAVARAVVHARAERSIDTTCSLAEIVGRVVHHHPGDIHPATRTFQALRMFVNDELGELVHALAAAERVLKAGGRLVVVSFHSLEDRIVKTFFTSRSGVQGGSRHRPEAVKSPATFRVLTKRPLVPSGSEVAANPRARSAKLRAGERTKAPAQSTDMSALPPLPALADVVRRR